MRAYDARIGRLQLIIGNAEPRRLIATQIVQHRVRRRRQVAQNALPLGRPQVQRHRALVAIERLEEVAVVLAKEVRPHRSADITAIARILDLDHLSAHVGELHGTEWPRTVLLHRQDAHTRERQRHTGFRATSCRAMMMRCSSFVPSPITSRGASRYSRSTENSVEYP